ncbi:hypothetical protein GKC32_08665 [Lactobacillus curvatus]|uniref:hypothetical protein n=1 Tax=Latilactobacillus fragifolii TaxID=2814244 RepID=UPI0012AF4C83|nr:hypothetical protein [Latilactobacillus fragifolii]MSD84528.1 hypothetical protein [Latilactobacillus curvatus]MSE24543.1 hypothetical protein [Latilactobacillus curvatus]
MQKMINKLGYKKAKWSMIALVLVLTIMLVGSITMAAISYHNYNVYTTITM